MSRKIFTFLLFIGLIGVLYVTILKDVVDEYQNKVTILDAIPDNSSFIVHFEDFGKTLNHIQEQTYNSAFLQLPFFEENKTKFDLLDTIWTNGHISEAYVAAHLINSKKLDFIWFVPKQDQQNFDTLLEKGSLDINKTKVQGEDVYEIFMADKQKEIYILNYNNFLVITFNSILIEDVINSINNQYNFTQDTNFQKLFENERNTAVSVFLNYNRIPSIYRSILSPDENTEHVIRNFADWAALEVELEDKAIHLTGYSNFKDSSDQWLSGQSQSKAQAFNADEILPKNTIAFLWMGLDLSLLPYTFSSIIGNEVLVGYLDNYAPDKGEGKFGLVTVNEGFDIHNAAFLNGVVIDSNNYDSDIFMLQAPFVFSSNQLKIFQKDAAKYYVVLDGYLLFSNYLSTIEDVLYSYNNGHLLKKQIDYVKFRGHLSTESNVIYYQSNPHAYNYIYPHLSDQIQSKFSKYFDVLKNFRTLGLEFTNHGDKFFTNVTLIYHPVAKEKSLLEWEIDLGVPLQGEISFVNNHKTSKKNIMVQDVNRKIYLLDLQGNIKWKKILDGYIQGKVQQVDLYKNKKFQYIFNTESKIYCLDLNGKIVERFPIRLPSKIIGNLSILDYDHNKKYRFFVGCENGKLYGFGDNARKLGYSWPRKLGVSSNPLRYFKFKGKDYLVVVTDQGKLHLLNRKGESRTKTINLVDDIISKAYVNFKGNDPTIIVGNELNEIITSNLKGNIKRSDLSKYGILSLKDIIYSDFDEYEGKELLCVEDYAVNYIKEDTLVFKYKSNAKLDPKILLKYDPYNKRSVIGFNIPSVEKVVLINQYGYLFDGFPVYGNKGFDLLVKNADEMNIITYDKFGKIFLYKVN